MIEKNFKVNNSVDASTCALIVQTASKFPCNIYLQMDNKTANAKSIMGMISLSIMENNEITIKADGEKEDEAVSTLESFILSL